MMKELMGARPKGAPRRDVADLQRLIRFVERWRMAHFQRPDARLRDADELLGKLRRGLAMAAEGSGGGVMPVGPMWVG